MLYIVKRVAWVIAVIGALNWGLVGLFQFNLVESLLGFSTILTMIVYDLVGLSALVLIGFKIKKKLNKKK